MEATQFTVLLISAEHITCQWLGLRALVREQPDLPVLADVPRAAEAVRIVTAQHPDRVLVDAAVGGMGLVPFVRQARRASPESRVVVIGTKETLRRDTLLQLVELGVRGYLLWEGLSGDALARCLAVVEVDDLLFGHRAVLEELLTAPERRRQPRNDEPALTDEERTMLTLLCEGLTQQEIAREMCMSEITARRMTAALRDKFAVRTTYALCAQVGRLGLVS